MAQGIVGLGVPKKDDDQSTPKTAPETPTTPASAGGLVGLGGSKPGATAGGSLVGLGASKPAAAAPAAAAAQPAAKPRAGIGIDVSAADRIKTLLSQRKTPEAGLRIRVRGGGCTGLQYDMEFAEGARDRDRTFEDHGVRIFVDPKSYIFLIGTTLTYQAGLLESGFKLENPNVKKSCGCGESFSV
jgi:iron-sulfur cluster assembly protein